MKKLFTSVLLLIFTTTILAQSWMQEVIPTYNKMNAVGFANDNFTGWSFGDSTIGITFQYGSIYKTTNQGFSWTEQDMGTDSIQILDCHVFSNTSVIGVGKFQTTGDGAIIRTTNGGITWDRDTTTIPERLFDVEFEDTNNGWVVGRNGYIGNSSNGGVLWSSQTSGTGEHLFSISFSSTMNGWAVGADGGSGGTILHTSDGGSTWNAQSTNSSGDLMGVFALNSDTAYAIGQLGLILFTSDGGTNWITQTSGTNSDLSAVVMENSSNGRATGNGGVILTTTDAGLTWSLETSNTINDINNLFYGESGINWYCGDNGDVYIYTTVAPNGINEFSSVGSAVFPNPAKNIIYIQSSSINNGTLHFFNLSGALVFETNWQQGKEIQLESLNSGLYFYVLDNGNNLSTGKFIKQ